MEQELSQIQVQIPILAVATNQKSHLAVATPRLGSSVMSIVNNIIDNITRIIIDV